LTGGASFGIFQPVVSQSKGFHMALLKVTTVTFSSAEDAWFWVFERNTAGSTQTKLWGEPKRSFEPEAVLKTIDRLYRNRQLQRDHLHVLAFYGRRMSAPRPERRREMRAHALWTEAFQMIDPALKKIGVVGS
jgi:hypothetical protein